MFRRYSVRSLAAILAAFAAVGTASAEPYRDAARHFTVEVPKGWRAMTAGELEEVNDMARRLSPEYPVEVVAGFYPRGAGFSEYPHILVHMKSAALRGLTYEEIEKSFNQQLSSAARDLRRANSDGHRTFEVAKAVVDRNRNRIIFTSRDQFRHRFGSSDVRGFCVGHFTSDGVIFVESYCADKDWAEYVPVFSRLNDSFRLDPGHAFARATDVRLGSIDLVRTFGTAFAGGTAAATAVLVVLLLRWASRSSAARPG
jgi:hypothetical protein